MRRVDAPVSDAMFAEPHQPCAVDGIEQSANIRAKHPVHLYAPPSIYWVRVEIMIFPEGKIIISIRTQYTMEN